jgi:hypothetical protein
MIAKPTVTISHVEELFADEIGQLWSPAKVTLSWTSTNGLRAPTVAIDVIAPARGDMTLKELRQAQLQAAHDVLGSALISLEEPEYPAPLVRDMEQKRSSELPIVRCPGCQVPMKAVNRGPSSEAALEEVIYKCPSCGTETPRIMKPPDAPKIEPEMP